MYSEILWLLGGGVVGIVIGLLWIRIASRIKAGSVKYQPLEFQPRERPRKSSQFESNSGDRSRQSKARIIGPK